LRQSPICEVYQQCGGCSLQHLNPYNQIHFKLETLKEQMAHFGQVVPDQWLSPVQSPYTQGYRHKARLGVRYVAKKDKVLVGFRERNGKFITDSIFPNRSNRTARWIQKLKNTRANGIARRPESGTSTSVIN
jgi:tRNA/tmRNA/rRNA uracil-C5-methylase (TrmA/RlmC/RlmD family)